MSDKISERVWANAPSEFWIVPNPGNWIGGHAGESMPIVFSHKGSAEEYAKKQSQKCDAYYRVYRVTLHGTAIPQDSQFAQEST